MPLLGDIEYVPPPSIGHEIGIMFGFLGFMALSMGLYVIGWQHGNIRGQRKEAERIEALRASGFLQARVEEREGEKGASADVGEESRSEEVRM